MKHILLALLLFMLPLQGCQIAEEQLDDAELHAPSVSEPIKIGTASDAWLDLSTLKTQEMADLQQTKTGIQLAPGKKEGALLSATYALPAFDRLVPSWKIDIPPNSEVHIEFQVGKEGQWSDFYPLGIWSEAPRSQQKQDAAGFIAIDTLTLYSGYTELRFRLNFFAEEHSPVARNLGWTTWQEQERVYQETVGSELALEVPTRSQFLADPAIASEICSPTCLAMFLEYHSLNLSTEEVAAGCLDHAENLYGNWSFAAAYANSKGLELRVTYLWDYAPLLASLQQGEPVICSLAFPQGALNGSPISSSPGHLVIVCGWQNNDGQPVLLVNDPAAPNEVGVPREYCAEEFFMAWNGIAYLTVQSNAPK